MTDQPDLASEMAANAPVPADQRPTTISQLVTAQVGQLEKAVGNRVGAERLARVALTEIRKTPRLAECTIPSLMGSIMVAAQLRLEPGSPTGLSWLVPMRNQGAMECQFWIGYRGMIELAHRSGRLKSIVANDVREGDEFDAAHGTNGGLHHRVDHRAPPAERGPIILYYAYAEVFSDHGVGDAWIVMHPDEIDQIRDSSPSARSSSSPWKSHYDAMARKTCVRQLWRWLPQGTDTATAETFDQQTAIWTPDQADAGPRLPELDPADLYDNDDDEEMEQ